MAKQGLIGEYRFAGKAGACDYVRQAGCIQFDPVDVCGKNAELTLQSRVDYKLNNESLLSLRALGEILMFPQAFFVYRKRFNRYNKHDIQLSRYVCYDMNGA